MPTLFLACPPGVFSMESMLSLSSGVWMASARGDGGCGFRSRNDRREQHLIVVQARVEGQMGVGIASPVFAQSPTEFRVGVEREHGPGKGLRVSGFDCRTALRLLHKDRQVAVQR